jgi:hypothetical protein
MMLRGPAVKTLRSRTMQAARQTRSHCLCATFYFTLDDPA